MIKKHLYTSDDKLKWWGYGEWVEEPDEVFFEYEGIQCKVIRIAIQEPYAKEFCMFGGHLCGYVAIPSDHPCYQKRYKDIDIDVHCGLTYGECSDRHWIGFDCAHSCDFVPSIEQLGKIHKCIGNEIMPIEEEFKKYSIFNPVYRNIVFCIEECKSMAEQLKAKVKNDH